jgi:hypothetical protein
MTTSTAIRPSVRTALAGLIDYAGLFPPAELPLADAVAEYRAARGGPHAWMLGRFIVPEPLLAQAAKELTEPYSVIVEPSVDALNAVGRLSATGVRVDALEIPLQKSVPPFRDELSRDEVLNVLGALEADLVVAGLRELPAFVEIPRKPPWRNLLGETMSAIARFGLAAKVRCGGVTAQAFPSVAEVADFVAAAASAGVRFKATAGLHHPVRRRDAASGFTMHGFLNLIAAAALAGRVDDDVLRRVVSEEESGAFSFDGESLCWRDERISLAELECARRDRFVGYGSCSFDEPVEDLEALAVLPPR